MTVKVGVVGAGHWGMKHVQEYQNVQGASLEWVVDPDPEVRNVCGQRGVKNLTKRLDEVLKSDVDALSICVHNDLHYSIAKKAMEAGKHVLVEKPLTMNYATSLELVRLAHEQNVELAVGHIFRFNNAVSRLTGMVDNGLFGDIYTMVARWTTLCDPFPGRDVVFDLAPHAFDIMNQVLDEWPERITCTGKAYRREDLEESSFITAEFPSGVLGHIEASWLLPGKVRSVDLVGSKLAASVDVLSQKMKVHDHEGPHFPVGAPNNTILSELQHFVDSVSGKNPTYNSGLIGARTVRCVEAAVISMRNHKSVELEWDL